jgi:hypothetical protein
VIERARLLDEEKEATRLREEIRLVSQIQTGLLPVTGGAALCLGTDDLTLLLVKRLP